VEKNRSLKIHELEASGEIPLTSTNSQRTSLSILCKHLAGICYVCNCRMETTERFSGLNLCQICDAFFFPKVSTIRFGDLFTFTPLGVQKLEHTQQLLSSLLKGKREKDNRWPAQETPDKVHFWRLKDLLKLLSEGLLERLNVSIIAGEDNLEYNAEDYGHFYPPNSKAESPEHWPRLLIWETACRRWNYNLSISDREVLAPLMSDMILLEEFRYRFDRNWTPKGDLMDETRKYCRIATSWVTSQTIWQSRPWSLGNFPPQPRSSAADPLSHGRTTDDMVEFDIYQSCCTRLRRILKVCPAALSSPALWQKCFSTILESNAQEMEATMKEHEPIFLGEPPQDDFEFVLRRDVGGSEVQLIGVGNVPIRDLADCIAQNCNLDTVCIKADLIEITDSETGANVKLQRHVDNMH
jgi:hypothetical protein